MVSSVPFRKQRNKISKEKNFRITLGPIPETIRLKPKTSEWIIPRAHVDWNQKNAAMRARNK